MTKKIKQIADQIVAFLTKNDFSVQRYDAYSTNSIYLKLDYGVSNTIRISDHEGKKHLCYRYNLIIGGEVNIVEEKYMRYYFNESTIRELLMQILFDKKAKIEKYGTKGYRNLMYKNRLENNGTDGFWQGAKLIHDTLKNYTPTYINEKPFNLKKDTFYQEDLW